MTYTIITMKSCWPVAVCKDLLPVQQQTSMVETDVVTKHTFIMMSQRLSFVVMSQCCAPYVIPWRVEALD